MRAPARGDGTARPQIGPPTAPDGVDGAFMSLEGVFQTSGSVLAGRYKTPGRRPTSRAVLVILAMRRSPHEARAAPASRRQNAVKPRIHYVLTQ